MRSPDDVLVAQLVIDLPAPAGHEIAHIAIQHRDCRRCMLDEQADVLFACAQRLLSIFQLGNARLQCCVVLVQLFYFRKQLLARLPGISHVIPALASSGDIVL
jgi:hypothetical protein